MNQNGPTVSFVPVSYKYIVPVTHQRYRAFYGGQDGCGLQRCQVVRNRRVGDFERERRASVCLFREDSYVIEIHRGVSSCSLMTMTEEGKEFVIKSQRI